MLVIIEQIYRLVALVSTIYVDYQWIRLWKCLDYDANYIVVYFYVVYVHFDLNKIRGQSCGCSYCVRGHCGHLLCNHPNHANSG